MCCLFHATRRGCGLHMKSEVDCIHHSTPASCCNLTPCDLLSAISPACWHVTTRCRSVFAHLGLHGELDGFTTPRPSKFFAPHPRSSGRTQRPPFYTTEREIQQHLTVHNMPSATPIASTNAGLPPNSYIYKIISTAPRQDPLTYSKIDQLAIISSDDSLRFLDPANLSTLPNGVINKVNDKVTCLERANDAPSNVVATAGRDGYVRFWDKRTRQKALEIQSRTHLTDRASNIH